VLEKKDKMEMFKKPKWLKPEINQPIYYLHLIILAAVTLWIINLFYIGHFTSVFDFLQRIIPILKVSFKFSFMFSIKNILLSVPALTLGDITAHSILRID